jgi:hypothetical protein
MAFALAWAANGTDRHRFPYDSVDATVDSA